MKNIEIHLKCDIESALKLIGKETDPPTGIRLLRIMKDPWFWGKIEKNQIKIWPKGPNKDISSSYIKGYIDKNEEGSIIVGKIVNDPVLRIPSWLIAVVAMIGFPSFGYFMYSFLSMGDHFIPALIISLLSIGIFFIGIMQRTSEDQEKDLEKFLRRVFEQNAISIKIA